MTFEEAVRKRLKLEGMYIITCTTEGGQEFQLGDYTWDNEPYVHTVQAVPSHMVPSPHGNGEFELWDHESDRPGYTETFDDLPSIWKWLEEEPGS